MSIGVITRRSALAGLAVASCAPVAAPPAADYPFANDPRFAAIEARIGGRVGVAALDTHTNAWLTHRAHERFAMCSTFKWLLAAQVLYMDEVFGRSFREQRVRFGESDLLDYAPAASANLERGWMTAEEMCEAIVVLSDNTCANKLLEVIGGLGSFNAFLRPDDAVTRLDNMEPDLNEVPPGEEHDTTSPDAMARSARRFLLSDAVLSSTSQNKVIGWMVESQTGRDRLRAGLPPTWRVGDKTGTWNGAHNATNDVAIAWPPNRAPIIIASYLHAANVDAAARNAAHAEIGRIIAEEWS